MAQRLRLTAEAVKGPLAATQNSKHIRVTQQDVTWARCGPDNRTSGAPNHQVVSWQLAQERQGFRQGALLA